jgi:hypothetical protein
MIRYFGGKLSFSARLAISLCLLGLVQVYGSAHAQATDPLPSWNEGPSKARIVALPRSVIQTAICRFCNKPRPAAARA